MSGVNKVIIVGRLGADPELKTAGTTQVTKLNIATSESWIGKDGQKQEKTEWHRVVVWGKAAEHCAKFLAKGRQVFVEGKVQTRSWDDDKGQKRYATEIVASNVQFLGSASDGGGQRQQQDFGPEPTFDSSDEIPF